MKNKQAKSSIIPVFFLCLCLAFLGYGCLGLGGGGGNTGSTINPNSSLSISGRAFFQDRQLYGNIPITVKNIQNETVAVTTTDSKGNYGFSNIEPGVYSVSATSGESEVTFAKLIQVTSQGATEISPVSLLGINNVIIDKISSNSFHLEFTTNRPCNSSMEYSIIGGFLFSKNISQSTRTKHEITVTGLNLLTDYEITIYLTGEDGQEFIMKGLTVHTLGLTGCYNLSVNINNGAYETKNKSVTLNLNAENCDQMRISENYSMEGSSWISYTSSYNYSFNNTSTGIKRLYVQFKSKEGTVSPIEYDSIVYTSTGYLGIWINDGEAVTNKSLAKVTTMYPGATQMIISDNINFTNAFWEIYSNSRQWNLTGNDGQKTIYCKFKGGTANPDEVFTASILYSTTPPKVEIVINNGATTISTTSVELKFLYSNQPTQMKISNETEPNSSQEWTSFKSSLNWVLTEGDGAKTVYGIFRDSAGNEYGPVTAGIMVDTVAPTGNSITIKESDDSASNVITTILIENLPVYLHFNVTDNSTIKTRYYIGIATTTPPLATDYLDLYSPFNSIELTTNNLIQGENKIWALFYDEAGNESYVQTTSLTVEGPEIIASPTRAILTAGQGQSFITTFNNIDPAEVGRIKWSVASGPGTIDSDGVYTAPNVIYKQENIIIKATSTLIPTLFGIARITLQTAIQIVYLQNNGSYEINQLSKQISPGQTATFNIYTLHSNDGIKLTSTPVLGEVSVTDPVISDFGSIATISYKAPDTLDHITTVNISFCSKESNTITGKVSCTISDGANIDLTASSYISQRNIPLNLSAEISNTALTTLNWSISPASAGSFSPTSELTTTTTNSEHKVTFYASTPNKITQASITAEIDGASKSVNISVYPPISITINPIASDAMPIIANMPFTVESYDYMIPGSDESLTWEFKNANSADFMPADGKPYSDRGTLTIITNNQVQYKRPVKLPSSLDENASDTILIRATCVADQLASSTAMVRLAEKVEVKIYDDVEKQNEISTAATVIEVGSLQFYAKVTPEIIGNTSVTWTVNGISESDSYGNIDATGKYTAPKNMDNNKVMIRATSNYDSSSFAEVEVSLSDFWIPKREGMVDKSTGEPMPISKIFVDPSTREGEPFVVYAGTGAENQFGYYGLWVATFSDVIGNTTGGTWQGMTNLSSNIRIPNSSLLIYDIVKDRNHCIYVSTASGVYYIEPYNYELQNNLVRVPVLLINLPKLTSPLTCLETAIDSSTGKTLLLAGCNSGVYQFTMASDHRTIEKSVLLIDTQTPYKVMETRYETETSTDPVTGITQTNQIPHDAYSYTNYPNPILSLVRSLRYDNLNQSLYFGTASGNIYYCPSLASNMEKHNDNKVFAGPSGINLVPNNIEFYSYVNDNNPVYPTSGSVTGVPMAIALDVINTNTLWVATTSGVRRSIDYGQNWSSYTFGGVDTNCRTIIVDPNNTINVMSGSEDGLYRTTDGGQNWTRIKSGLGNYKTITALTQAAGAAGKRRKVWVGTSGGVFIGKQSLSLE